MKVTLSLNLKSLCLVAILGMAVAGCESKFNEDSPEGVASADIELKARVAANTSLDEKLNQVESSAIKLKNIINLFRKAGRDDDNSYTPVDFALDLSRELKKGFPLEADGHFTKQGQIILPIAGLSPECQKVDAIFQTIDPSFSSDSNALSISQVGVLSLKSCNSSDYVDAFEIRMDGTNLSLIMKPHAFSKLFSDLLPDILSKMTSTCVFGSDKKGITTQVNCSNLALTLNKTENLILDVFNYDIDADISISGSGKIYNKQSNVERPLEFNIGKRVLYFSSSINGASEAVDATPIVKPETAAKI